ncbi:MAG: extracellular solute-binding protein [Saccharofermentanales bacterium]
MKKARSIILLVVMLATVFLAGGCGGVETTAPTQPSSTTAPGKTDPPETTAEPEETVEITAIWWSNGGVVSDEGMTKVNEALEEITVPLINVKVNLEIWDVGTYVSQAATVVANNEDVDLMITFPAAAGHFTPMTAQKMLLPLDDLLETYAPETLQVIPEGWWSAVSQDGKVYGVPIYFNKANNLYLVYDAAMADAVGFAEGDVKSLDDIYEMLVAVKAKFPEVIPVTGDNLTLDFTYPGFDLIGNSVYDVLGETSAVAAGVKINADGTSDYKVFSRYEDENFKTMVAMLRKWYNEGLIDRDAQNYEGRGKNLDGTVFCFTEPGPYSSLVMKMFNYNNEARYVQLGEGFLGTGALRQMTVALPVSCDEPEAAAKFLNLLYTNEDVINLVNFGVEGEHYVVAENGQLDYPEGMSRQTTNYYPNAYNYVGNYFLNKTWVGTDPQLNVIEEQALATVKVSPLLGMTFDVGPIGDIHSQLSALAHDEYGPALFTGAAPDGWYEEFIAKMKTAGLDEYMAELQRQIDDWLAKQ